MTGHTHHAKVRFPPPLVFLGNLVAALVLNWFLPIPAPWPVQARLLGGVLIVGGLLLGGFAVSRMHAARTSPDPDQPTTSLIIEGPYRLTRNPIYLGFALIILGGTFLAGTLWGMFLAPFLVATVTRVIIRAEEQYLQATFAGRYSEYRSRVRQWL